MTDSLTLLHLEQTFTIPVLQAMNKFSLFQKNPLLLVSPYRVQSPVSLSILREFISVLEGNTVNITSTNLKGLQRLCEEFGFDDFAAKLSNFCEQSKDSQGRQLINSLAGVKSLHLSESFEFVMKEAVIEIDFAESLIFPAVREQLSVDGCARKFFVKVSEMESADIHSLEFLISGESISNRRTQGLLIGNVNLEQLLLNYSKANIGMNLSELMMKSQIDFTSTDVSVLSIEELDSLLLNESISIETEDALLGIILKLGPDYRDLLRHIQIGFLSQVGLSVLEEHFEIPPESIWQCVAELIAYPPLPFDSGIISSFQGIFTEFRQKRFSLLWRGSRDGFGAFEFHRRCDGHANTLTVILDTKGNIFGGFTPVKWESSGCSKVDDSLRSFLFTLKNPHNIPARRFALKAEYSTHAIYCNSQYGPCFSGRCDILVSDNCNTNTRSQTDVGWNYTNDTELDNEIVFTGSKHFQVEEIEVFEITE
jgi:hypothetical protein